MSAPPAERLAFHLDRDLANIAPMVGNHRTDGRVLLLGPRAIAAGRERYTTCPGRDHMKRALFLGVAIFILSIAAVGCSDDDSGEDGDTNTPVATTEPTEPAGGTPEPGDPTEPLSSEIPQDVIDATEAYIVAGNIASFPSVDEIVPADECTSAGQVCYDADQSDFDETTATIRVYPYASDDIQNVLLENQDGTWIATSSGNATE